MSERGVARPLSIAGALALTVLEIALFTFGMRHPAPRSTPTPMTVRLVTLPSVPADAMPVIETEAPSVPQPPAPSLGPSVPPDAMPVIEIEAPPMPQPPPAITLPRPAPVAITPSPPVAKPRLQRRAAMRSSPRASTPQSAPRSASDEGNPVALAAPTLRGGGTMGARAIYKPIPEIPEELRRHPMSLVAVARFHIAADGSATVDLLQSTSSPRLNTALLGALKTWRFFPAMENGRPVVSTVDIRIPIQVQK